VRKLFCFNCNEQIKNFEGLHLYKCKCGLAYNSEILNEVIEDLDQKQLWQYVKTNKLFKIVKNRVLIFKSGNLFVSSKTKNAIPFML
jgi:hypothetical protein